MNDSSHLTPAGDTADDTELAPEDGSLRRTAAAADALPTAETPTGPIGSDALNRSAALLDTELVDRSSPATDDAPSTHAHVASGASSATGATPSARNRPTARDDSLDEPDYGSDRLERARRMLALFRSGAAFGRDALRIRFGLRPKNPFVAGVTINTVCNLRCSYCFIGRESEHFPDGFAKQGLPADEIKAILRNIRRDTGMLIITGGEPFLHRQLEEILRYAKRELRFVNISVATNGLFLTKKSSCLRYIDRLGISYDFTRAREYPKEMERMLGYLTDLKSRKLLPPVHFTMTLLRNENLEPLERFSAFCAENGFKIWLQPEREHGDFRDWSWFIGTIRGLQSRYGRQLILNDLKIVESFAAATSDETANGGGAPAPKCYPELRVHINEDGNLCFPCNRLEHLYPAGSVKDSTVMGRWKEATAIHGQFPREECNGCGFTCYFETAGLYARPHSFLLKAFKHIVPDRARARGL